MIVSISTLDRDQELKTLLELSWLAKPNKTIPSYWTIDVTTQSLFELSKELETLGYLTVITMSYNLVAGENLPAIHLHRQG